MVQRDYPTLFKVVFYTEVVCQKIQHVPLVMSITFFPIKYCVACKKSTLKVLINLGFVTSFEDSHYILLFRYIYGAQLIQRFCYSKHLHVNRNCRPNGTATSLSPKCYYCMARGGVFIGRVLKFWSGETDLFPHYRSHSAWLLLGWMTVHWTIGWGFRSII